MSQARGIIDNVRNLKSTSDSMSLKKTKGTITGGFIGMGVGLLYGFTKGYNLISSAFVGAIIGGVLTQIILPKINQDEDE
jgi:outer membrane lipoprotein SlyB